MAVQRIDFEGHRYSLEAPDGDWIGQALASGHPYEPHLVSWAARFTAPRSHVVDAGAYIGNHAIYWALRLDCTVHAFEPNPEAVALLRRNVAACEVDERVVIHEVGLGATGGTAALAGHSGTNFGSQRIALGSGTLRVLPLDEFELAPTLMKIDVEGMELDVLRGALRTIQQHRPVVIVEDNDPRAVRSQLRSLGYHRIPLNAAWTPTYVYAPDWSTVLKVLRTAPYRYLVRRRLWRLAKRLRLR
jgi:FkbM family methyltransferase